MQIIVIDQPEAFRQLEDGLRCPVCGERMEVTLHAGHWFLECTECVTVFGGFSGSVAGGFASRIEVVEAFLQATLARKRSFSKPTS